MSIRTKLSRLRAVLVTMFIVIAVNMAISITNDSTPRTGVAIKPDSPRPRTGVAIKPDSPRPRTGVAIKPDSPRP